MALAGIAGVSGYAGHEYAHTVLGAEAYAAVSIALALLGFGGLVAQEYTAQEDSRGSSDMAAKMLAVAAIGGSSFGIVHQMTHGNLFGIEALSLNLQNTSYWLGAISASGVYLHEYFTGRL